MRDCKALFKVLVGILAFTGACGVGAVASTLSLGTPVTPDLADTTSRWEYRTTTTFDVVNNRFFVGATDVGAGANAIAMLTTTDESSIAQTSLTPALIYAQPYATTLTYVANPAYNARVWEMDYFVCGTNTYVAAIIQLPTDVGQGGSQIVVINTADAHETYISNVATTLENENTTGVGTVSKFVKLAAGLKNSSLNSNPILAAVADNVTGEFDTSKATVGIRGFQLPSLPITSNLLPEFNINNGALVGKGKPIGNTAGTMNTGMRRLTSMICDTVADASGRTGASGACILVELCQIPQLVSAYSFLIQQPISLHL